MNSKGKRAPADQKTVHIIIGHACNLTRRGLTQILTRLLPQADIVSVGSLLTAGIYPEIIMADLVVSDISYEVSQQAGSLEQLLLLPKIREGKPVLIIEEREQSPALLLQLVAFPNVSVISAEASRQRISAQIAEILAGKRVLEMMPEATATVAPKTKERLTNSEQRVMALLQAGLSVTQIAGQLCRSVKTVSTHKRQIMRKFGVTSEVALFARNGEGK